MGLKTRHFFSAVARGGAPRISIGIELEKIMWTWYERTGAYTTYTMRVSNNPESVRILVFNSRSAPIAGGLSSARISPR